MRIPKVRTKKLKKVAADLYECTDKRATSEQSFEGSAGGGGYIFYGYEDTRQKNEKKMNRSVKYANRKASNSNVVQSTRPTRILENG